MLQTGRATAYEELLTILHKAACKHTPRKSVIHFLPPTAGWQAMAISLPPMSMPPMLAKTPHLLCAVHRMPKLFPDVTRGDEPQRGITHTKALVYFTLESAPRGCPRAHRSHPRTLHWLSDGPVRFCGRLATPEMLSTMRQV